MRKLIIFVTLLWLSPVCFSQLTQDQKVADFNSLVALYNRNYGPLDWKERAFHFDALDARPWLDEIRASSDDLSFYDICIRYVASLHDSHDEFTLNAEYEAYLPLTADIYDGKVLIDYVDTTVLDPGSYPIQIGDELLSVDGIGVGDWIRKLAPYSVNGRGNPLSTNRLAVGTMLDRYESWYTYAEQVKPGDAAVLRIKSQASGNIESYRVSWQVIGIPLFQEGPVSGSSAALSSRSGNSRSMRDQARAANGIWGIWNGPLQARQTSTIPRSHNFHALTPSRTLAGGIYPFDSMFPLFNPPPGFRLRLGAHATDEFVSGTFPAGNQLVGFIRIPGFEPNSESLALSQFQTEIEYFQKNTAGLVIDLMDNGGGDLCYTNELLQFLFPQPFQSVPFKLRPTEAWLEDFAYDIVDSQSEGAPQFVVDAYASYANEIRRDLSLNKRLTETPIPICSYTNTLPPATDTNGNVIAYTKPIVVLNNNFTLSAAETFAATLQDAERATMFGTQTDGGGGNVVSFNATAFSEGNTRVTESLEIRNHLISTTDLPSAPYVENIGVQPDLYSDYQTRANLLTGGQPFVEGFTIAIAKLIELGHP
jgi:hypothetical protein